MDRLSALIASVRRRWFAAAGLRIAGTAMASASAPLLAGLAAYWLLTPSGGLLLTLAAGAAGLAVAAAIVAAIRIEPRPGDVRVARFIEERVEALPGSRPMDDCVVSAVQASTASGGDAALLAPLVVQGAVERLEGIEARAVVPGAVIGRSALAAGGGALLLAMTLAVGMPALLLAVETARVRFFPASVSVDVMPGDVRVVAGRPLTIRARIQAGGDALDRIPPRLVVTAGDAERTVEMIPARDGFTFDFESVDRSFQYRVTAGAAASSVYSVTALFAPRVERIDLEYRYPSFSGLAPRTEEDGGDIYAPAGTRVRVRIHADKPVVSGQLSLSKGSPQLRVSSDRVLEADLVVRSDDAYRISLVDRDGLGAADDSEYFIRVMQDRPPDVRVLRPGSDQGITPLQEVAVEARAEDDYGVASLDLVYSVAGGPERRVRFSRISGSDTDRTGAHLLAAEDLGVRPGDVIAYYAVARDVGRGRPSTEVKSDLFFLEVKPFNEEFEAAQSQATGAGGGDPQIESLIEAQKDIITATWNIERRSLAGRSAEDVKAIARAQADLKARVERMLAAARGRRGRAPAPQRISPQAGQPQRPGSADPVAAAAEAMTRAIEQLASERTRDAIPHEMAALNGLLQAQAEVRRRQVAQQQRSGGGGGNRQSQDLSALFDKELQRQQQTNYEQRSQVEERPDQQQDADRELLDRIRDLARRQEELNRQQQEAARQQAEERRRQLDRLAREQQELQRQVEELSKQMNQQSRGQQQSQQQQGQQQQGQQQGQSQGQGSAGARAAIDQMRRAADEMRRESGAAAAQSGQRAADELRKLEQRLRGSGADARERAVADLQAEAQQIAQEQRRIAAEAERMGKAGDAGGTDARRRLAADKDRLADRVDELRRDAERLGAEAKSSAAGSGDEPARAREAAGELRKQRVGDRMREGAEQLREGSNPASGQGERQITQALERVVETLGGTASADAQRLADQLDRSRAARERLDALEAQLREAEARGDGQASKLREQYQQELGRARESFGRQPEQGEQGGQGRPAAGRQAQEGSRGGTPERQEFSRSAPGTEAFKQDRSGWASLRRDVDRALEQHDADVSRRLARALGEDHLSVGGSDRVPEHYRRLVAKYYESLAKVKK